MAPDDFLSRIESLRQRLAELRRRAAFSDGATGARATRAGLKDALDEVNALQASLVEQNRNLSDARISTEKDKERYQELFEFAPDSYFVTDRRGVILEANQSAARSFRVSRKALIGRHLGSYIAGDEFKRALNQPAGSSGSLNQTFETRLHRPGKILDVLVSAAPSRAGDSLLWLVRDLSGHKETEEKLRLSERLATMGATAVMLVQEISNPLNGIFTTIQRLQRELAPAEPDTPRATVRELMKETSRLRELMQKFRSFSRPARDRPERVDLCAMISGLLAANAGDYARRGITVKRLFLRQPLEVRGDYERLQQAFGNLIENAVEAMPHGGRLTVRALARESMVVIDIIDTGIGVPKGIDIFGLFTTTKFQGLGMGLPIVQQVMTDHGGKITCAAVRRQTVFRAALPSALPDSSH